MKGSEESQFNVVPPRTPSKYVFDSICPMHHNQQVKKWDVGIGDEFEPEFYALPEDVQDEILAHSRLLQEYGPQLGRPRVDTLNGSRHANMKELRFHAADGVWRIAFAFDTRRHAILLVAGDKSGGSEKRFYDELIRKADKRFDAHLGRLRKERK
ncbi:MAG: type II toxin-antitoxin system RelE/ParE family toxin [Nitrospira sp.]|nr:type II toxin-antitoxin system RelE/ParE family toxin [Nitrospira sp.]